VLAFVRFFLLAFLLEVGVIYNLQGLNTLTNSTTGFHVEDEDSCSIKNSTNSNSNNFSPFEILETDAEEEIDEDEYEKSFKYFSVVKVHPYFNSNFSGKVSAEEFNVSSFQTDTPLFILFHSWKFHLA
jgi:hypothetical protein